MPVPGAAVIGGKLYLSSNGAARAAMERTFDTPDLLAIHGLAVHVERGPVTLSVKTEGGADIIAETVLRTGRHSLALVPPEPTSVVRFETTDNALRIVAAVGIDPAGDLTVPSPFAESELFALARAQQANVVYVAGNGPIRRIERRSNTSWSIADMLPSDGPFLGPNLDDTLTVTNTERGGIGQLTASRPLWKPGHVGALWKIIHAGQAASRTAAGDDQWSPSIKVTGVGATRAVKIKTSGTFAGNATLQRSLGNADNWAAVATYPANGHTATYTDDLDNNIAYYRIGVASGDYTSGSSLLQIEIDSGSTEGVCRITGYYSATQVDMEVIRPFARADLASARWTEGAWSDLRGWPTRLTVFDARLWCGTGDYLWGSAVNAYESFQEGDLASDAISRPIGAADVNEIRWMLGLGRLFVGTEGAEAVVRASAIDESLTPTNNSVRKTATVGAADVAPLEIDAGALYVERSGWRVNQLRYDPQAGDYVSKPLMRLHRMIGRPGIVQMAVQRQPDTRAYLVRADGQCIVCLYDTADAAIGFCRLVTEGAFESVCVLPAAGEDTVLFSIRRTVGNVVQRLFEKLDPFWLDDALDANRLDSFVRRDNAGTAIIDRLDHLEGKEVWAWADGAVLGPFVVTGGRITLDRAYAKLCVGILYESLYRSSKLAVGAGGGTPLNQLKRPTHFTPILYNSVPALEYGADFTDMDRIADRLRDSSYDTVAGLADIDDMAPIAMPGGHKRDARVCLRVRGPYPVSVAGYVLGVATNERVP